MADPFRYAALVTLYLKVHSFPIQPPPERPHFEYLYIHLKKNNFHLALLVCISRLLRIPTNGMGQMTASIKDNLTTLASSFNNDFKQFLASRDSRILPKLKSGIVQQPVDYIYWQKECGVFEAKNIWGRRDGALDVISIEGEGLKSNFFAMGKYDEHSGKFSHDLYVEEESGWTKIVKPRPECLMYVGQWSYLEGHSDVKQKEHWYWNTIKSLKDSSFESALSSHPAYRFFMQNVDRVNLHDSLKGSHDDEWLLRICLLRVVAGAIEMYDNPLREDMRIEKQQQALDANLGKLLIPDQRTAKAASRLIENIHRSGASISWMSQLQDIANRKPYSLVNSIEPKMALVREVSLLSKMLLNTSNGHKGRFPTSAIQNILEFINEEMSDSGIQYHLERYEDSDEKPLSSGHISGDIPF